MVSYKATAQIRKEKQWKGQEFDKLMMNVMAETTVTPQTYRWNTLKLSYHRLSHLPSTRGLKLNVILVASENYDQDLKLYKSDRHH